MANENTKNWEFQSQEISTIEVQIEAGAIVFSRWEGSTVKVELTSEYNPEECEVSAKIMDSKLILKAKSKRKLFFWRRRDCKTSFKVSAPADKKIIVKAGVGHVEIKDFTAGAEVSSGAGIVEFKNTAGPISIKTGAGIVLGELYSQEVNIKSGAVTVNLSWTKLPEKGMLSIKGGAGVIVLSFPSGSRFNVNFKSAAGSIKNELGSESEALFKIDVKTGAGSLYIKKR